MKAQGLPLNTIVLGALAVLVLVILAAVFVPGVGNMFRSIFNLAPDAYTNCQTVCTGLSNRYSAASVAGAAGIASSYCVDPDPTDTLTDTCYDYIQTCTITLTDGSLITLAELGVAGVDYNCD
jgi:hypothetical protein